MRTPRLPLIHAARAALILAAALALLVLISPGGRADDEADPLKGLIAKPGLYKSLTEPPCSYCSTQDLKKLIRDDDPCIVWRRGSVNGLLRWLVRHEVKLPIRPHLGANRGELEWRRPNRVTLLNMLHHPIYAGAYRWGHREVDPRRKVPGKPASGRTFHAHDECRVLIHDRFAAYISWDVFEQNQHKLAGNSTLGKLLSAPRHGPSILAGLVVCGRCGHHMLVGYGTSGGGSRSHTLRYSCLREAIDYGAQTCQSLSGAVLESFVVERLLQAVSPASLELSLAATADIERERQQLDDHWQQRLARSRYEVEQARRQYAAVDPEHRLVARELERRWDESLRAEQQLQADYARFQRDCPTQLSPPEREQILALSHDLPALWRAESRTLSEIAETLNAEGFHPPKRSPRFSKGILGNFLQERRVRTGSLLRSVTDQQHLRASEWWLAELAAELSMPLATLHRWQRVGWVTSRKVPEPRGRRAIYADADELRRLRQLRDSPRGWPQPYPTELITPKPPSEKT